MLERKDCPHCERSVALKGDGELYPHKCVSESEPDTGSDEAVADVMESLGYAADEPAEYSHTEKDSSADAKDSNAVTLSVRGRGSQLDDKVWHMRNKEFLRHKIESSGKRLSGTVEETSRKEKGAWVHVTYSAETR